VPREYDEKRDFVRISVDCAINFKEDDSDDFTEGRMVNLSGRGMLFTAEYGIPIDTRMEVKINPEKDITPPLHARIRVVRMEKNRKGTGYYIGAIIQEMLDD